MYDFRQQVPRFGIVCKNYTMFKYKSYSLKIYFNEVISLKNSFFFRESSFVRWNVDFVLTERDIGIYFRPGLSSESCIAIVTCVCEQSKMKACSQIPCEGLL